MRPRWLCSLLLLLIGAAVHAGSTVEDLRGEVDRLRKEINAKEEAKASSAIGGVDRRLRGRYGPRYPVGIRSTEGVKLEIQGLLQIWYQSVQNDNLGITTEPLSFNPNPRRLQEQNELLDNDTFRIRRTELRFSIEVNENISAFFMIDPAREHNPMFYPMPTLPRHNVPSGANVPFAEGFIPQADLKPRLLQDAYISFDGIVPHHSFAIGQFKPPSGEEASRNSGQLDFVERSMVTGINNVRDIGAMVSGYWLEDRVRYAFGLFNGPSGTIFSDPEVVEAGNRSDDNDEKDLAVRLAVRPVWSTEKWYGRLEVGYHRTEGIHGEAGTGFDPDFEQLNATNNERTAVNRQGAWAWYRPNGKVKGFWLRGEWGSGHDRFGADNSTTGLLGIGSVDKGVTGARGESGFTQANPSPVTVSGWYFATGYRLADSIFAAKLKESKSGRILNNIEFAFRYESFENVNAEDLLQSDRHTDQFKTQVYTAGINYYIKGRETKIQINYLFVDDPSSGNPVRGLREVRNDALVVNFQLGF
ncbi:MAG TPA: porin [Planctomycetota bacterium]|nr:porin [Planctomycetota bacterium]